jgi:acetoin utilization protein AcuB
MSDVVRSVAPTEAAAVAWEQMHLHGIHHLVVLDGGTVVGTVSAADLGGPHGDSLRKGRVVGDVMSTAVVCATPSTTVREAANLMRGHATECLPVVTGGRLLGVLTASDIVELVGRGAERPVTRAERMTLKSRGERPRAVTKAKATSRVKVRAAR